MFFIWVILATLLQATVLNGLNLLVLLAVFSGLRKGPFVGLLVGVAIGVFACFFSASSFGLHLALYGMVGFVSGIARAHIYYKEDMFMQFVFCFCGLFLFYFMYFILTNTIQVSSISTVLFSAALSPVLFKIVEK
ncbi:hypothetical protein ACFL0P_07145 [Candidatus Omnitrophota bacterium]